MNSLPSSFFSGKLVPGMMFTIISKPDETYESNGSSICRSMSTYGYTEDECQFSPSDEIYLICQDGSLMNLNTPDVRLGFNISQTLCEDFSYKTFYRVLQVGFYETEIMIIMIGTLEIIPETSMSEQVFSGVFHGGSPLEGAVFGAGPV